MSGLGAAVAAEVAKQLIIWVLIVAAVFGGIGFLIAWLFF